MPGAGTCRQPVPGEKGRGNVLLFLGAAHHGILVQDPVLEFIAVFA